MSGFLELQNAVVTKDVPDYALILGNPGRQKGWMSRHGHVLKDPDDDGVMSPESGYRYRLQDSGSGDLEASGIRPLSEGGFSSVDDQRLDPGKVLRCLDLE